MTEIQERNMETKLKEHYYCSKCGMPFETNKASCEYHENDCGGLMLEYYPNRNTINRYYLRSRDNKFEDFHIIRTGSEHDNQYNNTAFKYAVYFHNVNDTEIALRKLLIYVFDEMCECAKRELNVSFDYTLIKLLDFKMNDE